MGGMVGGAAVSAAWQRAPCQRVARRKAAATRVAVVRIALFAAKWWLMGNGFALVVTGCLLLPDSLNSFRHLTHNSVPCIVCDIEPSACALRAASPFSNSAPTILSKLNMTPMVLCRKP